jgi:hypothetical protein
MAGGGTRWERKGTGPGELLFVPTPTPTTPGGLVLSRLPDGAFHLDPVVIVPPPPPPPNGAPPLPTGSITVGGVAVPQTYATTFASQPPGTYWFQSPDPGAGYNTFWPGNLAVPSPEGLNITTENQGGKVASGGVGMSGINAQAGSINVADYSIFYGRVMTNLVRYGLWWPGNWPVQMEYDKNEGWPGHSRETTHFDASNLTVGHNLLSAISEAGVWYAVRCIWVPGASGYQQTLVGDTFDDLVLQDEITAAELSAAGGPASGFDGSPHCFDIAVEAEGPIDVATDLATPNVDVIGGLALYELAA